MIHHPKVAVRRRRRSAQQNKNNNIEDTFNNLFTTTYSVLSNYQDQRTFHVIQGDSQIIIIKGNNVIRINYAQTFCHMSDDYCKRIYRILF